MKITVFEMAENLCFAQNIFEKSDFYAYLFK